LALSALGWENIQPADTLGSLPKVSVAKREEKTMNPILADIYSTVIPSAPFLIAAYAIVWAALLVYVIVIVTGLKKTEAQIALLEQTVEARAPKE